MKKLYDPKRKVCLLHVVGRRASRSAVTISTLAEFIKENFAKISDEEVNIVFLSSGELGVMFRISDDYFPFSFEYKTVHCCPKLYDTAGFQSDQHSHAFTSHLCCRKRKTRSHPAPLTLFYLQKNPTLASVLAIFEKIKSDLRDEERLSEVRLAYLRDSLAVVTSVLDEDDVINLNGYEKVKSLPRFR